jgi:1-deoxy-D-xylulose-5-phosphate synthase
MGYPNPNESPYDLFMTGHAGCSIACSLGLKVGDDLLGNGENHSVAVIGDGALPSGIVFEALNNAGHLRKNLLVILNDNKMSICPRVGALASCLDRARLTNFYQDAKRHVRNLISKVPLVGGKANQALEQFRDAMKTLLTGGMLFEELGFRYIGPVDGHDLPTLRNWLSQLKEQRGPVLLHVLTEKGHGVPQASEDPVTYHTPPVFEKVGPARTIVSLKRGGSRAYTDAASAAIHNALRDNPKVAVITAAMCQGNKLEKARNEESGHASNCRYLFDVSPARIRSDLPGGSASKPAGHLLSRPSWIDWAGRANTSRRLRHDLPALVPELRGDGAG